jgi:ATP-binding cassette subfamily C protein
LSTGLRVFVETTFILASLIAVVVVTAAGATGGTLIGLMALFAYVGFRVVPSANRLMLNFAVFQGARPHVAGLCADLALLEPVIAPQAVTAHVHALPFDERVALDSVMFRYDPDREPALTSVSLEIGRGESVGIIGATGAGKSTFVDVLLGLLEPQSGRVVVDGRDIRSNLRSWQARVGYVPQTFTLLDDTLRRNVAFGCPDTAIDDARVESALRLARLGEMVAQLPGGLDAGIGERGVRLSGGERQRLAIARALYHDPDVLVFDEATSALDHQTEQAIVRAIDELRGVKTLIVVAHRLTTVRGCDRIVILDAGRITADGPCRDVLSGHPALDGVTPRRRDEVTAERTIP